MNLHPMLQQIVLDSVVKLFCSIIRCILFGWWLRFVEKRQPEPLQLPWGESLFGIAVTFVEVSAILLIFFNTIAWIGYRRAERKLGGDNVPGVSFRSVTQEMVMGSVIIIVIVFAWNFFGR